MENITKPSITRLARRAGIKSISDDCFDTIRDIVGHQLDEIISTALVVNTEHNTKTLMISDIQDALSILNYNVTHSADVGTSTCTK